MKYTKFMNFVFRFSEIPDKTETLNALYNIVNATNPTQKRKVVKIDCGFCLLKTGIREEFVVQDFSFIRSARFFLLRLANLFNEHPESAFLCSVFHSVMIWFAGVKLKHMLIHSLFFR